MENSTEIVLILQGLNETKSNKQVYFVISLFGYLFTVLVNLTLIVTIILEKTLHEPMLIFLCNLCINGLYGASTFYPKMLVDLSSDVSVISYIACLAQMFVIHSYAFCELTTLTVMAYDRYVAICKPLNYHSIITPQKVVNLLLFTWLLSVCESVIAMALVARLPLCRFSIKKLYCSSWAVIKLSCVEITLNDIYGYVLMLALFLQSTLILISYINIVKAAVRSQKDRAKFMQTCVPHLIALTNFWIAPLIDVYARYGPNSSLLSLRNFMSLEYLVVPPLLNPLLYGLKLNQIRQRIFRICSQTQTLK